MVGKGLTVVTVPSIGLIRQFRLAWLDWAKRNDEQLDTLPVCSDSRVVDASENRDREEARASTDETQLVSDDPTEDWSYVGAWEVVGRVAKDSDGIKRWLDKEANRHGRPVTFSTYQSGY